MNNIKLDGGGVYFKQLAKVVFRAKIPCRIITGMCGYFVLKLRCVAGYDPNVLELLFEDLSIVSNWPTIVDME